MGYSRRNCQHGVEPAKREAMYTSDRKLEGWVTQAHWSPDDATLILSKNLQGLVCLACCVYTLHGPVFSVIPPFRSSNHYMVPLHNRSVSFVIFEFAKVSWRLGTLHSQAALVLGRLGRPEAVPGALYLMKWLHSCGIQGRKCITQM